MKKIVLLVALTFFTWTLDALAVSSLADCYDKQLSDTETLRCHDVLLQELKARGVVVEKNQTDTLQGKVETEHAKESRRFGSYERNGFMLKKTSGDDSAIELNVSMRYFIYDGKDVADWLGSSPYAFFSYTSKADFYSVLTNDTRTSAPVISRYQNPAIHVRFENSSSYDMRGNDNFGKPRSWFDFALEHISNGQAFDVNATPQNKAAAINAYNNYTTDPTARTLMDSISREEAHIALTFEGQEALSDNTSSVKIKWFAKRWGSEEEVFWGPYANQNVTFRKFQIVRAQLDTNVPVPCFNVPWHLKVEWNLGSEGLATDSWNFLLRMPLTFGATTDRWVIPLAYSAHRGPMNNLSDYTRNQNTNALGLDLSF